MTIFSDVSPGLKLKSVDEITLKSPLLALTSETVALFVKLMKKKLKSELGLYSIYLNN
jgi:hypothetical protein